MEWGYLWIQAWFHIKKSIIVIHHVNRTKEVFLKNYDWNTIGTIGIEESL